MAFKYRSHVGNLLGLISLHKSDLSLVPLVGAIHLLVNVLASWLPTGSGQVFLNPLLVRNDLAIQNATDSVFVFVLDLSAMEHPFPRTSPVASRAIAGSDGYFWHVA